VPTSLCWRAGVERLAVVIRSTAAGYDRAYCGKTHKVSVKVCDAPDKKRASGEGFILFQGFIHQG